MSKDKSFNSILEKYRKISFSQRDKGERFERLMQAYLLTDRLYSSKLKNVWLWNEFHGKNDLGGSDTGIDLVALTFDGDYWAIQCKCYQEGSTIDKPAVDSFLSTSSRGFKNEELKTVKFAARLWIDTTGKVWGKNAEEAIKNQHPPVQRIGLHDLREAPVDWGKLEAGVHGESSRITGRELKQHQKEALEKTHRHFITADRGQLIMACGTGKTFTTLRVAENETDGKGLILFLVPSIALLGQTLREWSSFANEAINAICICSDSEISRSRTKNEDTDNFSVVDLALPASTNTDDILHQFNHLKTSANKGMTVVFSTYQSIAVISRAQKVLLENGHPEFDLIICDEAHRTTGVSLAGEDESAFTKVHDNQFITAKKRLYMTATPRLYNTETKSKAAQAEAMLWSMDNVEHYGEEIYRIGFGEAVDKDLLTDYKVLILTLNENDIPPAVQEMIKGKESEIKVDDIPKLIGSINALSKQILGDKGIIKDSDPEPMRRAVAFCASIDASKKITAIYNTATEAYINSLPPEQKGKMVSVASKHIDGTMMATERDEKLRWLKSETENGECRVLTNVRCLSEGVDVPSLDAVLFLSARNSQVDVVQSVGRVMRKSPGKKYGYIIIPVVVPSNIEADKGLDDNERYKVVWTVLNALRAHDDRFNATVNKIKLNKSLPTQIIVGGTEYGFDGDGNPVRKASDDNSPSYNSELSHQLSLQFEQLQSVIFARMVLKVGDKRYWEQWASSVADIATRQTKRITTLVTEDEVHQKEFDAFLKGLQKNINPSISQQEAIEMLSQHIITKPVFEALFEGYSFVKNNPISVSMQRMLDLLEDGSFDRDAEILQKFYDSVKMRASGIDNSEGKQRIIIELYDKFFKTAFPKMVEKLGIVYTPIEVVDFILHSVNDVLMKEFGRSMSDEYIHVLDPFTGTGTFITRLLQSGLIREKDLERKYKHELHANEIVLLAYYIAAINIENAYHDATPDPHDGIGKENYTPFDGIVLTDTFQLGETDASERLINEMFPQNSERVQRQKDAPLRVIIGNPPYSVGQASANDNAQNQKYEILDGKITNTYAKESTATNKNSLYNSYMKAFRWSSDRIKNHGVIAFVTDGGWLDNNSMDGFRKNIEKEFTSIYVFNLRGNQRTSGELSRKEGGKIFGSGSRTSIAITLLVKKEYNKNQKAKIYYHDIGDYINREDKLAIIKKYSSIGHDTFPWKVLLPNNHGDWISQRNDAFSTHIQIGNKEDKFNKESFFNPVYSNGVKTNRDAWCYNSSKELITSNINKTISFYNKQTETYQTEKKSNTSLKVDEVIIFDSSMISWDRENKADVSKNVKYKFEANGIRQAIYRPFFNQNMYFSRKLNNCIYQQHKHFPLKNTENVSICLAAPGGTKDLSVIITDKIPDLHLIGDSQCFPLYFYEENTSVQKGLFDENHGQDYIRRDGISNFILDRAKTQYGKNVTKEDIFYYVYGFLHGPDYRETFANDLKKMLPRLPLVDDVQDFWKFSKAGRNLADLHLNYETVPAYEGVTVKMPEEIYQMTPDEFYRVDKMRFPKKNQKDIVIYNPRITISNIPAKAYEYVVNGKSAIEWILERYAVTVHKDSGIKNDPNDWSLEHGQPSYIFDLLLSVINVSVQTVDIVRSLPKVEFAIKQPKDLELNNKVMLEFNVNEGIYHISDVVYITGINEQKVRRWFKELQTENYEGISGNNDADNLRISFHGLIELVVIGTLRDNKFKLKEILQARKDYGQLTGNIYPFATNKVDDIKRAGRTLVVRWLEDYLTLGKGLQYNFGFIDKFFENIEFDTNGLAARLFPIKNSKLIVVDPKQAGGKAVVDGKGVWAETVKLAYDGPESIDMIAEQYEITKEEILDAIEYYN